MISSFYFVVPPGILKSRLGPVLAHRNIPVRTENPFPFIFRFFDFFDHKRPGSAAAPITNARNKIKTIRFWVFGFILVETKNILASYYNCKSTLFQKD